MTETLNIGLSIHQAKAFAHIELLDMTQSFTANNPNPYDPSTGTGYVITPESAADNIQMTSKKFIINSGRTPDVGDTRLIPLHQIPAYV